MAHFPVRRCHRRRQETGLHRATGDLNEATGTALWRHAGVAVAAFALCAGLASADSPTGGDLGVRAYVLSNIYFGSPGESGVCKMISDGGLETYLKMLPPDQQAKYAAPDKRQALEKDMNVHFGFRRLMLWPGD